MLWFDPFFRFSNMEALLMKRDSIDFLPDSEGKFQIKTFQGRRLIVDDNCPKVAGTNSPAYTNYLFGNGAFALGNGTMRWRRIGTSRRFKIEWSIKSCHRSACGRYRCTSQNQSLLINAQSVAPAKRNSSGQNRTLSFFCLEHCMLLAESSEVVRSIAFAATATTNSHPVIHLRRRAEPEKSLANSRRPNDSKRKFRTTGRLPFPLQRGYSSGVLRKALKIVVGVFLAAILFPFAAALAAAVFWAAQSIFL